LKMGLIRRPETLVKDYHSTLRNIPEDRRSHQYRCGSLKSTYYQYPKRHWMWLVGCDCVENRRC
jgi:hypothetical protein